MQPSIIGKYSTAIFVRVVVFKNAILDIYEALIIERIAACYRATVATCGIVSKHAPSHIEIAARDFNRAAITGTVAIRKRQILDGQVAGSTNPEYLITVVPADLKILAINPNARCNYGERGAQRNVFRKANRIGTTPRRTAARRGIRVGGSYSVCQAARAVDRERRGLSR